MKEAMQSIWIGIWSWIEGGRGRLKMKKWEKLQRGVGKTCFSISHSHAKWIRVGLAGAHKGMWKVITHDHAKFSHSHAKHSSKTKMQLMDFLPRIIMRNCWGSCENVFFSRFLDEEASGRPLKWCQVSFWPWPINRNMIDSFKNFLWIFPNCRTFQTYSLYIILYFLSFSLIFSVAKHVLWDQISKHEWLNLIFLEEWRI